MSSETEPQRGPQRSVCGWILPELTTLFCANDEVSKGWIAIDLEVERQLAQRRAGLISILLYVASRGFGRTIKYNLTARIIKNGQNPAYEFFMQRPQLSLDFSALNPFHFPSS